MWNRMKKPPAGQARGAGEAAGSRLRGRAECWRQSRGRGPWGRVWRERERGEERGVRGPEGFGPGPGNQNFLRRKTRKIAAGFQCPHFPLRPLTANGNRGAARSPQVLGDAIGRPRGRPGFGRSSAPRPRHTQAGLCGSQREF